MAFGEKLSEILEDKRITQKEFARILNIAPTTLNGYIKNKRQPDFGLVKKIAEELNVSADFLLEIDNNINLTSKEISMVLKLRALPQEQQRIFYNLVKLSLKELNKPED